MLIVAITIGSIFASLVPALVVKILMSVIFNRWVSYLMVLFGMVCTYVFAAFALFALGFDTEASIEAMPDEIAIGTTIISFVLQVCALNVVAADERGEPAGLGAWTLVLLLQYVVYFAIAILFVFVLRTQ